MKKIIIPIVILILAVVGISGCIFNGANLTNNSQVKNYTGYNVSFNYSGSWLVNTDNSTGIRTIVVTKKQNTSFNPTQLTIQPMPNNGMSEQAVVDQFQNSHTQGWEKISNDTLTIDGKTAYEDVYTVNDTQHFGELMRIHQIVFVKNDTTYVILLQAPDKNYDQEKSNFDIIINSLKVQ